jgi:hypothetical protein
VPSCPPEHNILGLVAGALLTPSLPAITQNSPPDFSIENNVVRTNDIDDAQAGYEAGIREVPNKGRLPRARDTEPYLAG